MARKVKRNNIDGCKVQKMHRYYPVLEQFAGTFEVDGEYKYNQLEVFDQALWYLLHSIDSNLYHEIKGDLDQLEQKVQNASRIIEKHFSELTGVKQ